MNSRIVYFPHTLINSSTGSRPMPSIWRFVSKQTTGLFFLPPLALLPWLRTLLSLCSLICSLLHHTWVKACWDCFTWISHKQARFNRTHSHLHLLLCESFLFHQALKHSILGLENHAFLPPSISQKCFLTPDSQNAQPVGT